jgi:hypothetical protein
MKTKKTKTAKRERQGGDRLVRLTNGPQYVVQANYAFAIVLLGAKDEAVVMTLADAVDAIRDLGRYGVHRLYAELLDDQSL